MTADRLPRAGVHDGLYYSMGYSGHGTQMATHMGAVMAEVMSGRPEANVFRDLDWPAVPGHFGPPGSCPWWALTIGCRTSCIERGYHRRRGSAWHRRTALMGR